MGQMQRAYFEGRSLAPSEYLTDIGCRGKLGFDSHEDAMLCLKRIGKRGKDHGRLAGQRVYRCAQCRKWHTGRRQA